ncbi:membrane protein [Streptomyces mirabilis]|nr:membrane protein [Streptomyces mirabilis]
MESELGGRVAMEAGPRDTAQDAEHDTAQEQQKRLEPLEPLERQDFVGDRPGPDGDLLGGDGERLGGGGAPLSSDGPDEPSGGVSADGPAPDEMVPPEVEVELRPQRRLRIWQLAPIVILAATGSLMFAFPLAFEFGDGGAVVAMLGLLICSCAAGWGMMAARRVGYVWPGLPPRGTGRRLDWRVVLAYVVVVAAVAVLAVGRVARLR